MQSETSRPLYRSAQVVWSSLTIVETLLTIRFVLKLLQANPDAACQYYHRNSICSMSLDHNYG